MKWIRRREGTYRKSIYRVHIWVKCQHLQSLCLPLLPNTLRQNLTAFLSFKLKFFILKIESCAPSPPQTYWDILPAGKKWKFLAHQSEALTILAIVQFSGGAFRASIDICLPEWQALCDCLQSGFLGQKLPVHFSAPNITQVSHFLVCDLSWNFDQNAFHCQCHSSAESRFTRAVTSWSSTGEVPCP